MSANVHKQQLRVATWAILSPLSTLLPVRDAKYDLVGGLSHARLARIHHYIVRPTQRVGRGLDMFVLQHPERQRSILQRSWIHRQPVRVLHREFAPRYPAFEGVVVRPFFNK